MIKKSTKLTKKSMNLIPFIGIIFAVFGGILLGKLTRYQFELGPVTSDMIYPLSFIEWIAAVGCLLGGLYMIYRTVFKRIAYFRY